jgi:hypothetical protein
MRRILRATQDVGRDAPWLLLLLCLITGCAGPLEPGRLPTDEERCAFQGGTFHAGICHTRGGP